MKRRGTIVTENKRAMKRTYRIGTRTSPLALKQVEEVLYALKRFYADIQASIVKIDTYGDKDKVTPVSQIEGSDFFTREIDEALLNGEIDFAVHSAKDLPDVVPDGLYTAAITKSVESYDALVSKDNLKLEELPYGAKIGTSSQRRKSALKEFREDFQIVDIRGNIEERLKLLDYNEPQYLDAIVIAAVSLVRLDLEDRITQRIPFHILRPHPLQGALAIVTKFSDSILIGLLSVLDNRETIST